MGGHGGLNILPKKSWNVYNRDNRQRVARDEAAAAEKEQEISERHAAAEHEARLKALKVRARQRHGGAATINLDAAEALPAPENPAEPSTLSPPPETDAMAALEAAQPPPAKRQRREKRALPPPPQARQSDAPAPTHMPKPIAFEPERPQHINLFAAEEAAAVGNPEREAERRRDSARRGDPKSHTSDPRFDESFSLSYALRGGAAAPWYAAPRAEDEVGAAPPGASPAENAASMEKWRRRGAEALAASAAATGDVEGGLKLLRGVRVVPEGEEGETAVRQRGGGDGSEESSGDERRSRRRKDKGRGKKQKERRGRREGKTPPPAVDKWAVLREERLRREEAERVREREAVRAATGRGGPGSRRYHSGFGHGR